MKSNQKYIVLAGLYLVQTLPGHFFNNAVPVILRGEGFSLASLGFLQLIGLPWILKFLWAPLVDKALIRFKSHIPLIVYLELGFALSTVVIAFLSFREHFGLIVTLMFLSYVFAATQDIATDSYAIKILDQTERGIGNSVQTGGNLIGAMIGSGVALIFYVHLGWRITLLTLGCMVLFALLPLRFFKQSVPTFENATLPTYGQLLKFFIMPGVKSWLVLLFLSYGGSMAAIFMSKPLLVDLGYETSFIGLVTGVYGVGIGIIGAFAAGFAIKRVGKKKVFALGCGLNVLGALSLAPLSRLDSMVYLFFSLGLSINALAFLMTAINTIAMDFARPNREGTDYSLQVAVSFAGGMVMVFLSGLFIQRFNYEVFFVSCSLLNLCVTFFCYFYFKKENVLVKNIKSESLSF